MYLQNDMLHDTDWVIFEESFLNIFFCGRGGGVDCDYKKLLNADKVLASGFIMGNICTTTFM